MGSDRIDTWFLRLLRLRDFVDLSERWPSVSSSDVYERRLAEWMGTQRDAYRKGRLAADRAAALEDTPGWTWGLPAPLAKPARLAKPERKGWLSASEVKWRGAYDAVKAFVESHGRFPTAADWEARIRVPEGNRREGRTLASWIVTQQLNYQGSAAGKLSAERIAALEQLPGWKWAIHEPRTWEQSYARVKAFITIHGRLPKDKASRPVEQRLGRWVGQQRVAYMQGRPALTPVRIAALEALPEWFWAQTAGPVQREWEWCDAYESLALFLEANDRFPRGLEASQVELRLSAWVHRQREAYTRRGKTRLPADRIAALEALPGWKWWARRDR
jgi:hypothetical protein